jgi:hypothetical protein
MVSFYISDEKPLGSTTINLLVPILFNDIFHVLNYVVSNGRLN